MRQDDANCLDQRNTDEFRAQLRRVPPGLLYELAAARSAGDGDWRARGAALLLERAADEQVSASPPA